ncbi:MAG: magnesium chelatase subunit D [Myxococcaceae bacterium]|nr:magnesium chelatase subunit D [Myxococcaceae bacterium]
MIPSADEIEVRWHDALVAIELLGVDSAALGGVLVRCWPGPVRDRLVEWARAVLPEGAPMPRLPVHVTEDRLLGGLSLANTLKTGKIVVERGVLPQADGGVVLLPMSERVDPLVAAHLCAALDRHQVVLEREGLTQTLPCRLGLLALDEGLEGERTPLALAERLPLHLDLSLLPPRRLPDTAPRLERVQLARGVCGRVTIDDTFVQALCEAALQLGVEGLRASVQAVTVARLHAALEGRLLVTADDAAAAARLVLGPRATRMPEATPPEQQAPPSPTDEGHEPPPPSNSGDDERQADKADASDVQEILLAAAQASVPKDVLELAGRARAARIGPRSAGRAGAARASTRGGRPAGARSGVPQPGERLNLVETLRAAAPWQRLRRSIRRGDERRIEVRQDDLRVSRFVQKMESSVIFCVDASGSAALQRLAEAKGAVEQVLADCYVRRDHVALVAFRGQSAKLLLPPTRSLARVKKCLAELAGGGGTPLAAGIESALTLALDARAKGRTPLIVMMTDARANVARPSGKSPDDDALACARLVRAQQVKALFLDTSPRPRAKAKTLADEMGATYLPLPRLDARRVSSQVQQLTREVA